MRGHITKRGKGSWTIVVSLGRDRTTRKLKQQWVTVKGTKREADRKLIELLHQMETGTFVKQSRLSFGDFLDRWINDYVKANVGPRTAESYEHILRLHVIPGLGAIPLADLTPQHLQSYYAEKLDHGRRDGTGGLSGRTVRSHHVAIHGALQSAVKWNVLGRNPAAFVDIPKYDSPEMRTMSEEGLHSLLEAAMETPYYALFYLSLFTGMRRSEVLGLRWQDTDIDLGQLSVNRSMHRLRTGEIVIRAPKTAKGRRQIALPPSASIVLREHRGQHETQRSLLGLPPIQGEDLVFSKVDGAPFSPDTITRAWRKLARRVGIEGIRLHDARHTHATLMLKQGVHPRIVQERLGHASVATTLDTYSHVVPGLQEAAALRFDEGLALTTAKGVS